MKIAFIGTGNMGGALARAASREKENQLYLVNRHPEKAEKLQKEIGGVVTDLSDAVRAAELIVLGVKPLMLPALCEDIRPLLAARTAPFTVVSMAAGVTVARLREMLGDCPIIRIMPNTPVSVGEGMILYSSPADVSPDAFLHAMRFAGRFLAVEERLMNAGMAVSGCGPAFVDLFVEALADAGVAEGLYRRDALLLAAQMVLGSAKLILESGQHPGELKDAVCSPGGTTIQGVRKLEEKGFRSAVIEAVIAAANA
ncbi:MAG: pyrroline-5-carboxylate reductase [Oscillospiraceae bacterium]|nr:pyrroline-5-carboxylate reductase [Oscillospiraceae bacterium]